MPKIDEPRQFIARAKSAHAVERSMAVPTDELRCPPSSVQPKLIFKFPHVTILKHHAARREDRRAWAPSPSPDLTRGLRTQVFIWSRPELNLTQ